MPHARIKKIDTSRAEALEGVRGVVCYLNAPDTKYNSCGEEIDGHKTERVFDDTVRYVGDKVAAVRRYGKDCRAGSEANPGGI